MRSLLAPLILLAPVAANAQQVPVAPATSEEDASEGGDNSAIVVTAHKLDEARDSIQPALGASEFKIGREQLDIQPGGPDRGLAQVLLQAPGVTQDSDGDGELHVRNEHGNLQYRLNGVIVPESISGFGQALDTRIADSVDLITGTLPAQYGYRTSGVVSLKTRTDAFDFDGDVGIYGGSHGLIQPSATVRDAFGGFNVFGSLSYLQSDQGIENPTPGKRAVHDRTRQLKAFGYVSKILSDEDRVAFFGGSAIGKFEIPNVPGQQPQFTLNGRSQFDSSTLDQNQREVTHYGVASFQHAGEALNYQIAPFVRYSLTRFSPDPQGGDLILEGGADASRLSSLAYGLQADASLIVSDAHTVRFGAFAQQERTRSRVSSRVFAVDTTGAQSSDVPLTILSTGGTTGELYGVYLQDEWTISPALTFNFGARFDAVRAYVRESQISPRANLVFKPGPGTTFHLGYARNFTPPPQELISAADVARFNGTTRQYAILAGDPVHSEREHYFDVGIQQAIGRVNFSLDAYYKRKTNLLDEGQFGSSLVESPFNYARGKAWGVEASIDYSHGPLSLYANVARGQQKAKRIASSEYFFDPEEIAYVANHYIYTDHSQKWTASAGGSLTLPNRWGRLVLSGDVLYGDGLRSEDSAGIVPNGGKLPSYVTANIGIAQTFASPGGDPDKGFTVRLDVVNLADKVYLLRDGTGIGTGAPKYGARRGVFVGLRKSF
ncbi:TonB-dependent receptor [Novosphingobium tardum]|uniref:TonB-dependent receptor n=1 Tax=Novosphingobium tardum TaxID=1538021 RepID=A0ABV8RNN1_9SPHN